MVLLDTYSWIEYFLGSEQGAVVYKIILKEKCNVLEPHIAEIYEWALRENQDFNELLKEVKSKAEILHPTLRNWLRAAEIKKEIRKKRKGVGIMDALLLAKQEDTSEPIVTGDSHFEGLKNVVFLG